MTRYRPLRLAAVVLLAAAVPRAAGAGRITLDVDTTCSTVAAGNGGGGGACTVALRHRGDEPALAVAVELELEGRRTPAERVARLAPGAEWSAAFALGPQPPGRRPIVVRASYEDGGGYPFSVVAHAWIGTEPEALPVVAELADLTLERRSALRLRLVNRGATPLNLAVRLYLPALLRSPKPDTLLTLAPGAETVRQIPVEKAGSLGESSYQVYVLVQAREEEPRRALFAAATVRVATAGSSASRLRVPLLAGLAAVSAALAGLVAASRRRGAVAGARGWERLENGLSAASGTLAIALALSTLLSFLPSDLILSPSITTGGDTASHYLTAKLLVEDLLPAGRILGWSHENLAGYPIFQLYFPLPFLLMAGLQAVVGLPVAFKLGTLLGVLLLPAAALVAFRRLGFAAPAPGLAAVFTLPFLLNESHSVWGGNLPSTLAGEFAYSLGLALAVLFMGTSFAGLRRDRGWVGNGVLLALIGLSHAYTLLWAGSLSALHLLAASGWRRGAAWLLKTWAVAFALIGFWILPLLAYAPYTSPYRDVWRIDSWQEVVPRGLWPFAVVVVAAALWRLARTAGARPAGALLQAAPSEAPAGVAVLWNAAWLSVGLYLAAPRLGAVDIRFLPFFQLILAIGAAVPLAAVCRRWRLAGSLPLALGAGAAIWAAAHVGYLPRWAEWNYSGFEAKPLWPAFSEVNGRLSGSLDDPRVVFEHNAAHNAAGSIRAFESLPLFSGRGTLEGLYIQSGLVTPMIFYLQSEISEVSSCPLPDWHCGRLDVERAAWHLREFNVSQVVARGDAVKAALAATPAFELEAVVPPYEIHRVRPAAEVPPGLVVPLSVEPVAIAAEDWKREFFVWFKRHQPGDPLLVAASATPDSGRFALRAAGWSPSLPRRPLDSTGLVAAGEVDGGVIRVRTSRPGHPLLVRVAWHPRWRLSDGGPVYLASPGFMLVVPREREVELTFGDPPLVRAGHALTAAGLFAVGAASVWRLQRRRSRAAGGVPSRARPGWPRLAALQALALLAFAGVVAHGRGTAAPILWERGLAQYHEKRYEEAEATLARAIAAGPLSSAALHASFYRALAADEQEQWERAAHLFAEMVERFPESPYRAEAEYHIGLCWQRLGDPEAARRTFTTVRERFPGTPWAGYAADRLAELDRAAATGKAPQSNGA